jgi:two-component system response regulator DctR
MPRHVTPEHPASEGVVFIVDDDDGVRSALRMLVRSLGLKARAFASGEAFLEAFDGQAGVCVLLDVRMPGMSGIEVQRRLVAMQARVPVIFLTAHGEEDVPGSIDAVERVQKPFRDDYLVSRIRQLAGISGE